MTGVKGDVQDGPDVSEECLQKGQGKGVPPLQAWKNSAAKFMEDHVTKNEIRKYGVGLFPGMGPVTKVLTPFR